METTLVSPEGTKRTSILPSEPRSATIPSGLVDSLT
jgi:hypothetical protein